MNEFNVPTGGFTLMLQAFAAGQVNAHADFTQDEDVEPNEDYDHIYEWAPDLVDTDEVLPFLGSIAKYALHTVDFSEETSHLQDVCIYDGSPLTWKDFCRFLLYIQSSNASIGDRLCASVCGMALTFMPKDNVFVALLKEKPTMYRTLKIVKNVANLTHNLETFLIDTCPHGCLPFYGQHENDHVCPLGDCDGIRWKNCTVDCVVNGEKVCSHAKKPVRQFYYLSVRRRIEALLKSDYATLFRYEEFRHHSNVPNFMEDIYDSTSFKAMKTFTSSLGTMIYLQICWDGADMFNYSGKSMWPLCYSIMNFPPTLRDKPHVGKSHPSPLCTYTLPRFTYTLPLCTYILPLFTYILPLFTYTLPRCTYILPLFTYTFPLFTYIITYKVPLFTYKCSHFTYIHCLDTYRYAHSFF